MTERPPISFWIVEDNRTYRRAVRKATAHLEEVRCEGEFESAEAVISGLSKEPPPDVVLLDIGLPGESGLDALPKLRAAAPETRFVILTAFDDNEKIFRAICAGAIGYILKSGDTNDVANVIQDAFNGGSPMTPQVARRVLEKFAVNEATPASQDYGLTAREREVLQCMADGDTKKEIASRLHLSKHTVVAHLRNIYRKLHVNTNTAAVAKAIRERLI